MTASTEPRSGLFYGWALGENNWKDGMDSNLLHIGRFGFHLSVKDRDLTTPPASPVDGDRYIIPAAATGVWAGKTNQIAARIADVWEYHTPKIGWLCYIEDEAKLSAYKATGWSAGIAI